MSSDVCCLKGTGCIFSTTHGEETWTVTEINSICLFSVRVQLSEQPFRHSIQQHHLPVRLISCLFFHPRRGIHEPYDTKIHTKNILRHFIYVSQHPLTLQKRKKQERNMFYSPFQTFFPVKTHLNKRHLYFFICLLQQAFIQAWVLVCRNVCRVKVSH